MYSSHFSGLSSVAHTDQFTPGRKLSQGLRKSVQLLLLPLAIGVLHQSVQAQSAANTDIVGFVSVTALGNSDTRFSAPLHRPTAYQGVVGSVSGDVITVQGTPAWATSPQSWVYASGTQSNTYYVEFGSGAKEGMYYSVIANGANTLTLELANDTIEGSVVSGDIIRIIPYWTFSTLFPGQVGITGTTASGGAGAATKILFPDLITAGKNLATAFTYFYYTGTGGIGPSWRRAGSGVAVMNDQVILPDVPVIIRQDGVGTSAIQVVTGAVANNSRAYVLNTLAASTDQDNAISVDVPVPMTLTESNLAQSGAFVGTTSAGGATGGDRLFVYDNATVGINKAPIVYFYYIGAGGPMWRRVGGGPAAQDSVQVFQPGNGYVIRKAGAASPYSVVWTLTPSYTQ